MASSVRVRPLGHKILLQPDKPVTQTESGLYIPDAYNDVPPMTGRVLRMGDGPDRDKRIRARCIARCLSILDEASVDYQGAAAIAVAKEEIGRYLRDATEQEHICEVGDRVVFPMEAGHEIVIGEDTDGAYVIVSEDSILAVCEPAECVA